MLWPQKLKIEDIPQETAIQLQKYVKEYKKQKKKAALIHGPTGIGKTTAVHALAEQLNAELIEINASDYRTADEIQSRVGNAATQQSLFGTNKIILIDEIDGIAGREDRGGIQALLKIIPETKFPIIITANDITDKKYSTLKTKTQLIEFVPVDVIPMTAVLKKILDNQKITYDENVLKTIARRSGGDLRGAITDMQTLHYAQQLTQQGVDTLSPREQTDTIKNALMKIFKTTDPQIAIDALEDQDLDEATLWIDENLPKEYTKPKDLARAYDALSKADVFKGRIKRMQYWRYLVYVNMYLTAGIATAKDEKYKTTTDYQQTKRLLSIWIANQKYAKRKAISQKIAIKTHQSTKKALHNNFVLVQKLAKTKPEIIKELELDDEEQEWLTK